MRIPTGDLTTMTLRELYAEEAEQSLPQHEDELPLSDAEAQAWVERHTDRSDRIHSLVRDGYRLDDVPGTSS